MACTCSGAGSDVLENRKFRMIVIDEATQSTEASTLIPLSNGTECLVMAGDPRQLPPTIKSQKAVDLDFKTTLFDKLQNKGYLIIE